MIVGRITGRGGGLGLIIFLIMRMSRVGVAVFVVWSGKAGLASLSKHLAGVLLGLIGDVGVHECSAVGTDSPDSEPSKYRWEIGRQQAG